MRTKTRTAVKTLVWCLIFTGLTFLFRRAAPPETAEDAVPSHDGGICLALLTDDGIESVTMEAYLRRAVAAEMPASFGLEALKAQAVAIRTYVLASHRHDNADICADSGCCLACRTEDELRTLWGDDYAANTALIAAAVAETDGEVLTYGGKAIQAVFHASSAGATEASGNVWTEQPYLVSVASPETAEAVPNLLTTVTVTPDGLAEALGFSPVGEPVSWLEGTSCDSAGRVETVKLCGETYDGAAVRRALGLSSTAFSVLFDGESFVFTAAGSGHGVGMSQYGAKLLAAEGWTYDEILSHYYPGAVLTHPDET